MILPFGIPPIPSPRSSQDILLSRQELFSCLLTIKFHDGTFPNCFSIVERARSRALDLLSVDFPAEVDAKYVP